MGEFIGLGASFASNLLGLSANAPAPRSYNKELYNTLQTQIGLAPQLYGAESNQQYGQPAYARLALQNLGILFPGASDIFNQGNTSARTSTASDIAGLAPGLAQTYAGLNPSNTALQDLLTRTATEGLQAGQQMTPGDVYKSTNPIQQDYANRGLFNTDASRLSQALALANNGQALQQSRQNYALGVSQSNQQAMSPLYAMLGSIGNDQSGSLGYGSLLQPTLQGLGNQFNPESQYAGDINNQKYQTQAAINAGNASNNAAFLSSILSLGGKMAGAGGGH